MKKSIFVVLAALMLLTTLPIGAMAAESNNAKRAEFLELAKRFDNNTR